MNTAMVDPLPGRAAGLTAFYLRRRPLTFVALTSTLLLCFLLFRSGLRGSHGPDLDIRSYIPFRPIASTAATEVSLKPVYHLPKSCLDDYFAHGEFCPGIQTPPLDVLWTWVNGSDPLLQQAKTLAQDVYTFDDPNRPLRSAAQARLYRDHDELRHSMRSVLQNFRQYTTRFRLLTADFPLPTAMANSSNISHPEIWRLGQVPRWLTARKDVETNWRDTNVELSISHHAHIFSPYNGTNFNSLAIESQFSHLGSISENFVYMNDDLFMMNPITPATFYTPAFGMVLHLQSDLLVKPDKPAGRNSQGEWKSMGISNALLSDRFGSRHRPYVVHEAKTGSLALLHEMSLMWPKQFATSAMHVFRETKAGEGDVNTMFMLAHFVVERAREALLWSWVVGRIGALDDTWGIREATRAWAEVDGVWGEEHVWVSSDYRYTLQRDRVEKAAKESGLTEESRTSYIFSSLDGYPYTTLGVTGKKRWPSLSTDTQEEELPVCKLSYKECFIVEDSEGDPSKASEVFKNLAFRKPRCGDCVILALVKASGRLGLSAFLPTVDRALPSLAGKTAGSPGDVAHLSMADDWEDADFSLREAMGAARNSNVREWTLQLLQRYRYVIGHTPSMFERISSPRSTSSVLMRVERNRDVAMVCINDDVAKADEQVTTIFKSWQDRMWSHPAAWEQS